MLPAIGTAPANPATAKAQARGIRMTSSFSTSRPRRLSPRSASGRAPRIFLSAFVRIDGVMLVQLDMSLIGCLSRSLTIAIARCHQIIREGGMMYFRQFHAVAQALVSMVVVVEKGLFFIYRMATMSTISRPCPEIPPSNVSIKSSRSEDPKKTIEQREKALHNGPGIFDPGLAMRSRLHYFAC